MTTDTFTDAQGRRFVAGQEVPEVVWERVQHLADEIERLREALRYIAYGNAGTSAELARSEAVDALGGEGE